MSTDCLFCGIVAGDIPADVVHESDAVVVFRDINPVAPTHVLVIPKRHVVSAAEEVEPSLWSDIFAAARHVAQGEGLDGGWRLVSNVGAEAGQSVFHLHFHLLGGRPMAWPPG